MSDTSHEAGRSDRRTPEDQRREQEADRAAHDALSAIDAEHVIDEPGDPEAADPESPASETEAPPPG
jgi:hypothetical protein